MLSTSDVNKFSVEVKTSKVAFTNEAIIIYRMHWPIQKQGRFAFIGFTISHSQRSDLDGVTKLSNHHPACQTIVILDGLGRFLSTLMFQHNLTCPYHQRRPSRNFSTVSATLYRSRMSSFGMRSWRVTLWNASYPSCLYVWSNFKTQFIIDW